MQASLISRTQFEYLVIVPGLSGPCTANEGDLLPHHKVMDSRLRPCCPACGNKATYIVYWGDHRGVCVCGYGKNSSTITSSSPIKMINRRSKYRSFLRTR